MTLPRLLLVTDRHRMAPSFEKALLRALNGGARFVHLREKDLAPREVLELALLAQRLCERVGAKLVVNSRADTARAAHAEGVHLPETDLPASAARLSLSSHALCGVSVHSVAAARRAQNEGADYVVFGPVFATESHPNAAPAGLDALREVATSVSLPVFAIGGVTAENAAECRAAGAYGVAVIGAVWQADKVEDAVRQLLAAVG